MPGGSSTGSPSRAARRQAGVARAARQLVHARDARRARQGLAVAAPDGAEQVAQLGQRLAAGALDQRGRLDRRAGSLARATRRAAGAWTTITLRLCASTSCSSRAMRLRSVAMARARPRSRACSRALRLLGELAREHASGCGRPARDPGHDPEERRPGRRCRRVVDDREHHDHHDADRRAPTVARAARPCGAPAA